MCDNDVRDNAKGDLCLFSVIAEITVEKLRRGDTLTVAGRLGVVHRNVSVAASARERELLCRVESAPRLVICSVATKKLQEILRLVGLRLGHSLTCDHDIITKQPLKMREQ